MIDVVHQINEVRREVGERVLEAGAARTVTVSQTYDAGVQEVWEACTKAERISRWFLPVSGDLRLGGHYQLEGNAGGTIERCDPPRSFAATWEFGGNVTWIEVRVTAESTARTRFEIEHMALVDDHWTEFGPGAVGIGWDMALLGLANHLSSGGGMDPQEGAAWAASEEGKRFMTISSERWGDADVAAGADPADAKARADHTIAAYTGSAPPG